jgi:hypothetical protein
MDADAIKNLKPPLLGMVDVLAFAALLTCFPSCLQYAAQFCNCNSLSTRWPRVWAAGNSDEQASTEMPCREACAAPITAATLLRRSTLVDMAVAPVRSTVLLSPQRKTAPCARPARWKDDVFRQVSWLAGLNPSSPSQALACKAQWQTEEGLAADSCGGSSGFDSPSE